MHSAYKGKRHIWSACFWLHMWKTHWQLAIMTDWTTPLICATCGYSVLELGDWLPLLCGPHADHFATQPAALLMVEVYTSRWNDCVWHCSWSRWTWAGWLNLFDLQVVQVYITWLNDTLPAPKRQLAWFDRITVPAGKAITVKFTVTARSMALWLTQGWQISDGELIL